MKARVLGRALQHLSFPVHFKINYANSWWYSTVPSWPGSWGGLCQRNLTRYVTDCTESVLDVINEVVEEVAQSLNEQMVRKLSNFINEEELSKISVRSVVVTAGSSRSTVLINFCQESDQTALVGSHL